MKPATLQKMKLANVMLASLVGEVTTVGGKIKLATYKLSLAFLLLRLTIGKVKLQKQKNDPILQTLDSKYCSSTPCTRFETLKTPKLDRQA